MDKLRVAVIMGGTSSERKVSLKSGRNVAAALNPERYTVRTLDFTGNIRAVAALRGKVDVVVLALHGPGGEDGRMQGLLDLLGLPYTGSGPLASAMAMHNGVAKDIYHLAGIPGPAGITVSAPVTPALTARVRAEVGLPCVVKPANEGSTIGISIVKCAEELPAALTAAVALDPDLVVEQFVAGVEISVPVLGTADPRALPAVEIIPKGGFYDYRAKYLKGATEEICPARISDAATAAAADYALRAHRALRCRGVSRTDMIVTGDAVTVLETNTLPGMTNTSLLPLSARVAGIDFPALLDLLIEDALAASRA
jgi:D-alanine-D-alanine ligase